MNNFIAHINVMPHKELLDPQGKAVQDTLHKMEFSGIGDVRIGKHIALSIAARDTDSAQAMAEDACKRLLHNAVMEQYEITIQSV
jgi:phosphoribosylformylglycinamidine synthase subunit PurS